MKLAIQFQDEHAVGIRLVGRVTQETLNSKEDPLCELFGENTYARKVLLNLQETEHIDSSGISWLLCCHRRFQEAGGQLILYAVPPIVMNTIKILRLQLILQIAHDRYEALQKVTDQDRQTGTT